jgi:hypothetical protein
MQRYSWRNSGLFRPPSALIVTVVVFLPPSQIDGSLYFTLLLRDAQEGLCLMEGYFQGFCRKL